LARLRCLDYGYECDYVAEGEADIVIRNFRLHTEEEHGIDYSDEVLMQFILRKE
jgi:predicted small metal-binding protein